MDYEKEYKNAFERAKKELQTCEDMDCDAARQIFRLFPELAESEDERIRKWLIIQLEKNYLRMERAQEAIAWLKKQKDEAQKQFNLGVQAGREEAMYELEKEQNDKNEADNDFTIYHPLKNGKGEYKCIPYSFYGSLTSFSEDKDLIDFLRNCFYTEEECNEWIEQQKEQKPADLYEMMVHKEPYIAPVPIPMVADEQKPAVSREEILYQLLQNSSITMSDYLYLTNKQKPTEWSKEDENAIATAIRACRYMTENFENSTKQYEDAIERLKSIRLQHHWKPSEEQMEALKNSAYGSYQNGDGPALRELYEQLKKLM